MGNKSSSLNLPMSQPYNNSSRIYNRSMGKNSQMNQTYNNLGQTYPNGMIMPSRSRSSRRRHGRPSSVTSIMGRNSMNSSGQPSMSKQRVMSETMPEVQYAGKRRVIKKNMTRKYRPKH